MSGIMLHVRGEVQQLLLIEPTGMHYLHGKLAIRERTRLVEHHGTEPCERIHIVAALDEDALTGRSAESSEESQRHTDDQRART